MGKDNGGSGGRSRSGSDGGFFFFGGGGGRSGGGRSGRSGRRNVISALLRNLRGRQVTIRVIGDGEFCGTVVAVANGVVQIEVIHGGNPQTWFIPTGAIAALRVG